MFVAVVSAFALNNWNENRKSAESENKILTEIANGLEKDIEDIQQNLVGHEVGIEACDYFRDAISGTAKNVRMDTLMSYYIGLTRDYISIQNTAGYETLKSRGLELIKDDSLRLKIISLYEYDYNILRKMEEEYAEMQFQENYYIEINRSLAPNFQFDENSNVVGIDLPLNIEGNRKKELLLYLFRIQGNRVFISQYYKQIEKKVEHIYKEIRAELKDH
ncbi:MAG: DUF6090 family protein [Crocinitomicaceae bacterium]|nr:DUF6090 family protein [Crocinitomicaceae bacterium]